MGRQKHFCMETCACLVIPGKERKEFEIIASSQWLLLCQELVSQALGVPANRITVKTKRIGTILRLCIIDTKIISSY